MKRFGSSIRYLMVDLINIYKNSTLETFEANRNEYLKAEGEKEDSYFYKIDYDKMSKIVNFIDNYLDSVTCENEMKMECYFNEDEPAFINDKVNTKLFNFSYADKIYQFAQENSLDLRIHTIVWYRHFPKQLIDYLENRNKEDRKRLTLDFIRTYMQCLKDRYPNAYCIDVINEMAADPDEIRIYKKEGLPIYEYDDEGIRMDYWYNTLGKHYYIEIFKMAREVFGEDVKLFYNDCNEGNKEKQKIFITAINNIKEYERQNGIRLIDGFGMQSHYWGSEDETKEYMEDLYSFYTSLGLEIQITEFDVSNHSNKEIQDSIFNNFIEVVPKYGIETFTMWGLNDIVSWYGEDEASLIDKNCDFKPFSEKYLKAFSNKYNSNMKIKR